MKKTLVIGASEQADRYSYKAINSLLQHGHEVVAIGGRKGEVAGITFDTAHTHFTAIDTVTLYVNPQIQTSYVDYILSLKPKRVIFNPGTENPSFAKLLRDNNIETSEACTLVLLSTNQY